MHPSDAQMGGKNKMVWLDAVTRSSRALFFTFSEQQRYTDFLLSY
jgi:hypothetical protein